MRPVVKRLHSALTRRSTAYTFTRNTIPGVLVAGVLLAGCSGSSPHSASPTTTAAAAQANQVDRLLAVGINQAQAKQFAQAAVTFQDVLAVDPGNQYAWYNLGLIAQTENHASTAVSDYRQALKTNPEYTSAMYNEAIALEPTDRQQALSLYKQIVDLNPKAATAYLRMSFLYDQLGDQPAAAAARAKAVALDPSLGSVPPPTT